MTTYGDVKVNIFHNSQIYQKSLLRSRRSTCRLKKYPSTEDFRTWSNDVNLRKQNILERHNFYSCNNSSLFPWETMLQMMCSGKICEKCLEGNAIPYNMDYDDVPLWKAIYQIVHECKEFEDCFDDIEWSFGDGNHNVCQSLSCNEYTQRVLNQILNEKQILSEKSESIDCYGSDRKASRGTHNFNALSSNGKGEKCEIKTCSPPVLQEREEFDSYDKDFQKRECYNTNDICNTKNSTHLSTNEFQFSPDNTHKKKNFDEEGINFMETNTDDDTQYDNLTEEARVVVAQVRNRLYCIIQIMKQSMSQELLSQQAITQLKCEIEMLKERIAKQKNDFGQLVRIYDQQQQKIAAMRLLERKLKDVSKERHKLKGQFTDYSVTKNDEIDVLKKRQSCLVQEVQKLQIIERELSEMRNERDQLYLKVRGLERRAKEKDCTLTSLMDKLERKKDCINKLQKQLGCCAAKDRTTRSYQTPLESLSTSDIKKMQEKMVMLKEKFFQLENVILSQDRCLHEQHNYILEQEKLRICLQKKVQDLTLQQIDFLQGKQPLVADFKSEQRKRVNISARKLEIGDPIVSP